MGSAKAQIFQEARRPFQSTAHVLLVFLSLMAAFGVLSANHPALWEAFLPTLLMGLSYGVVSLSLDQLFRDDWEDGFLEWTMSAGRPLESYALAKIIVHWMRLGLPLSGMAGAITGFASFPLIFGIAATTLTLIFLGSIASALCLSVKANSGILLPLLTLPLGIPMMIASMAAAGDSGAALSSCLALQGGLFFMSVALSLCACPFALRLALR